MFCPNCGEKLVSPNQNFCAHCGSEIQATPVPEVSKRPQEPVVKTPIPPQAPAVPVYMSKPIKTRGIGRYSKKSFVFALIWPGFFIAGSYTGFISMIFRSFSYSPYSPRIPGFLLVPIVLHLLGLIFSINSRVNSSRARKFEAENGLQKAASIISVFGIVLNAIFLVLGVILMGLSIAIIPYFYPYY